MEDYELKELYNEYFDLKREIKLMLSDSKILRHDYRERYRNLKSRASDIEMILLEYHLI